MTANKLIETHVQGAQQRKSFFPDLRTAGLLAKWPIFGLAMFLIGSLMFGGLFYNLRTQGPLLQWDRVIAAALPAIGLKSPAFVEVIMAAGFYIGKEVIMVLGILLGLYFIYKQFWQELAMAVIGWGGAAIIFNALSTLIARPRPPTQIWIIVNIPGFPSGHAITVVVFYGLLAYLLAPKMPSTFWRGVVVAAALLIIGFVGYSRIYTGGHYLTDILAGYAVGIAWSGAAYTLIEIYYQKRRDHHVKKE
jgi:membrane-associated phospholipid phosphatase